MSLKTICVIIKDEHDYIEEWIEHNINIGFDKIYIYEDSYSKSHVDILKKYGERIVLTRFDDLHLEEQCKKRYGSVHQEVLFEYYIELHKGQDEWCAFIDPDEYIMFEPGWNLDKLINKFNQERGIYLFWKLYGANGHLKKPKGKIVDNYTTECKWDNQKHWCVKSIINFNNYTGKFKIPIHIADNLVNTLGLHTANVDCYAKAWINHYYTKSWEDWVYQNIKRGDLNDYSKSNLKRLSNFFNHNTDMLHLTKECYKQCFYKENISQSYITDDLISVCMCTHNRKYNLEEAIWSIISQSYKNIEVIILNDESTDGTTELLEEYKKIDNRIKVYNEPHSWPGNRNKVYQYATGKYIANMDDDDIMDIYRLEKEYKHLIENNLDIVACHTAGNYESKLITKEEIINKYKTTKFYGLDFGSLLFKRTLLEKNFKNNIYFLDDFNDGGEDIVFIIKLLNNPNIKVEKIADKLYIYYNTHNSVSKGKYIKFREIIKESNDDGNIFFKLINNLYE